MTAGREATGPTCVECGAPIRVEVDLHVCDRCEVGRQTTAHKWAPLCCEAPHHDPIHTQASRAAALDAWHQAHCHDRCKCPDAFAGRNPSTSTTEAT